MMPVVSAPVSGFAFFVNAQLHQPNLLDTIPFHFEVFQAEAFHPQGTTHAFCDVFPMTTRFCVPSTLASIDTSFLEALCFPFPSAMIAHTDTDEPSLDDMCGEWIDCSAFPIPGAFDVSLVALNADCVFVKILVYDDVEWVIVRHGVKIEE